MLETRVLFLDGEAIVLDKPAGLAVHPGPRTPDSLEAYLHHLRFGFQRSPTLVHRIDRDTSGCLLLARNPKAHKRFQRLFEEGAVTKTYFAVLDGVPDAAEGVVDLPLSKVSTKEEGWRMVPDEKGKSAVTRWRVAAVKDGRALVLLMPDTGRTHQLRVHAARGLGVPILGDPRYGAGEGPMLLHAHTLKFDRPGKPAVEAVAPLPETFAARGFGDADL